MQLAASIILISATAVQGLEIELTPVGDAFVCDCSPNVTNPNAGPDHLYQGQIYNCFCQTFIQWDLSGLGDYLTILEAKMMFYCASTSGSPSGNSAFYRIIQSWDENTVTHNNQPDHDDSDPVYSTWPGVDEWFEIDITGFVQGWYDGSYDNFGVYCHCKDTTGTCCPHCPSSNSPDSQHRPKLYIEYASSAVETESVGLIKGKYK
ncbi:MAG: DNRLRE domain-containing protein [bacterium]|nr:DNRLRE domain-containing protein [bacterium]